MFNLISSPWLPVRRLSGAREWIAPAAITSRFDDDPILALDFPRPDWNAAVTELLIGLLAVVAAPRSTDAWADRWATPFTPDELSERLARIAFAFDLDGDGPRAFQDLDVLVDQKPKPISALLIDAAGENAEGKNTDLFVKRAGDTTLCPQFAAAALITLQTYAPAGGQGNRTSMRGGGPLTTLAMPRRKLARNEGKTVGTTLWDTVWTAVPLADPDALLPDEGEPKSAWGPVFPWLAATRTSEKDRATLPGHAHSLQAFFGMPRRIRLDFEPANGRACSFDGPPSDSVAVGFRQKNYGVKYEGWLHPLSPHYAAEAGKGRLPFHPQPGGNTYGDWLTWVLTPPDKKSERAACLDWWQTRLDSIRNAAAFPDGDEFKALDGWQSGIHALGYDMDNMKARGWLEARVPFFDPPPNVDAAQWGHDFRIRAEQLVAGTDRTREELRRQVLIAVFGKWDAGKNSWRVDAPGKPFDDLLDRLWRETEPAFRAALAELRSAPADLDRRVRRDFLGVLRRTALRLFDEAAGTDNLADMNARRIVEARGKLVSAFSEAGPVARSLDIVTEEARQKKAARSKGGKREAA